MRIGLSKVGTRWVTKKSFLIFSSHISEWSELGNTSVWKLVSERLIRKTAHLLMNDYRPVVIIGEGEDDCWKWTQRRVVDPSENVTPTNRTRQPMSIDTIISISRDTHRITAWTLRVNIVSFYSVLSSEHYEFYVEGALIVQASVISLKICRASSPMFCSLLSRPKQQKNHRFSRVVIWRLGLSIVSNR